MTIGKKKDGTLKKGYKFAKGGRVVKAKVAKAKSKNRKRAVACMAYGSGLAKCRWKR